MPGSRIISLFLGVACAVLAAATATGAELRSLRVEVVSVADGDTVTVLDSNQLQHRVRLAGIDAPERYQPFADRSRQNLSRMVLRRTVLIEWSKVDQYRRFIAKVVVEEPGCATPCTATDVNLEQLRAGLAWHYKYYEAEQTPEDRKAYMLTEEKARETGTGLWAEPSPVPPWEWRRGPKEGPIKKSRNDICHPPEMPTYESVRNFDSFATLQECLDDGGRLPKGRAP